MHDYLLVMRGAERSFAAIADMWPNAPVATLLYDEEAFATRLRGHQVRTSALQRFGAKQSTFKALLPLMPAAAERLPVGGHDLVVSSSSAFAHGVQPDPGAVHVCYCYTPFRYAWFDEDVGARQAPRLLRPIVRRSLRRIRRWDLDAARRGTHYVAISQMSRARIQRCWGIDAEVVHPPVDLERFVRAEPQDFVLVVGELVRHKQAHIALEGARRAGQRVKVVGGGADETNLRAEFGGTAEFLGRISDEALAALYATCRALVVPCPEEFGITAVEAQACGRPVLAASGGGMNETVLEGRTGFFFDAGDAVALAGLLRSAALDALDPADAVSNAQRFSVQSFQAGFRRQVDRALAE